MASVQEQPPQLCVDNKWFPCQAAGEFGFLGNRLVCDLNHLPEAKKLLIRRQAAPQTPDASGLLEIDGLAAPKELGLRTPVVKSYMLAVPTGEKGFRKEEQKFLQQDLAGLIPLRQAILEVVKEGRPQQTWKLFYDACKALNHYAKVVGKHAPVPLQCPNSLAVDVETRQVIPLDAEIKTPR